MGPPFFDILLVLLGGLIGFASAYAMAVISRRAEERAAERNRKLTMMHNLRVPLSVILSEIDAQMGFYFNKNTVDGLLDRMREGAVALLDEDLIDEFERAVLDLRALGVDSTDDTRAKAKRHVAALLERLHALVEAEKLKPNRWRRWRSRGKSGRR